MSLFKNYIYSANGISNVFTICAAGANLANRYVQNQNVKIASKFFTLLAAGGLALRAVKGIDNMLKFKVLDSASGAHTFLDNSLYTLRTVKQFIDVPSLETKKATELLGTTNRLSLLIGGIFHFTSVHEDSVDLQILSGATGKQSYTF